MVVFNPKEGSTTKPFLTSYSLSSDEMNVRKGNTRKENVTQIIKP